MIDAAAEKKEKKDISDNAAVKDKDADSKDPAPSAQVFMPEKERISAAQALREHKNSGGDNEETQHIAAQMPLFEHLLELRQRLIRSVIAFALAFLFCFAVKEYILEFLLMPYQWAIKLSGSSPDSMMLQSTAVLETFAVKMKIAAFGGLILAFPFIAFQLYRFVAPGLYKNERAAFLPFLGAAPILFFFGAAFVYCLIAPLILWFSLSQQHLSGSFEIHFIAKISEYLDFMTSFILIFGCVFQLPVIVALLTRVGLLRAEQLAALRKWEIVIAFIVAAMLTPSDIFSMFGLALPLLLLYEFSILLAKRIEKKQALRHNGAV